jgi:hypothetical protein
LCYVPKDEVKGTLKQLANGRLLINRYRGKVFLQKTPGMVRVGSQTERQVTAAGKAV